MKVLLVEEDKKLNNTICEYLTCKDFKVVSAFLGEPLSKAKEFDDFDICIISNNLSDISGLDLLRTIKEKSKVPVLIINSSDNILELEKAFYYNCDEYMKKPFHLKELELRIYRVLGVSHVVNIHDDLIFNLKTFNLYYKDSLISLRKKEKVLLNILVKKRGKVVSKDEIVDYVWKNITYDEYPIRQLISNLRDKLPFDIIKTEIGQGYKIS